MQYGLSLARESSLSSSEVQKLGFKINQDGLRRNVLDLMAVPSIGWEGVCRIWPELKALAPDVVDALEAEALYAGYLGRQESEIAGMKDEDQLLLPDNLDYGNMPSLSNEVRQKLARIRPSTLGQASRIDGMTPAALAVVLGHVRRRGRKSAA
jgi:tRNA uridine 5-carboxymethylaminomethyl modification enzyme